MRNLHQIILQEYGLEVQHLFRDWERLQLRASDYKNHRIFTLRCLHKELVPVSIKLKSTLKTDRAKKIVRKAEKDLIQARIKAINSILDNVGKQTELCRSKLASIISTEKLRECQGFIDKVGEIRFNKVKQRQINKFQNLVNKKEGNITRFSNNNLPQAGNNLVINRQAGTHLPPGEGSNTPQPGLSFPLGKVAVLPRQLLTFLPRKEAIHPRPLLTFLQGKEAILPRLQLSFLLGKEVALLWQALRQVLTFPPGRTATLHPRPLLTFPLGKQAVPPRQLLTFL